MNAGIRTLSWKDNVDPELPALFRPDHLRKIFSVPQDAAAVSLVDTAEDLDERGLSGSVLTDEAMDLPSPREKSRPFNAYTPLNFLSTLFTSSNILFTCLNFCFYSPFYACSAFLVSCPLKQHF